MKALARFQEPAYALLRMVSGFLFFCHGTQKLFSFPNPYPHGSLTALTTTAAVIEVVAGALITIGLFTRPAAFISSGLMAVAYWKVFGTRSFFPLVNGGEDAVLYCFIFLFIAARGPGVWSVGK